MRSIGPALGASLVLLAAGAAPVAAQLDVGGGDWSATLGGRLQMQAAHTSADGAPGVDFFLRRARLKLDLTLNEYLSGRLQPEFAGGAELKDAYVQLTLGRGFDLSAGQFKRAFDLFELSSSTELSVIERDGRIPGSDGCPGVGRVCTLSRFNESLDYAGRDVGVRARASLGSRASLAATVTNGPGGDAKDENDAKSAAGRLVLELADGLRVAGNVSVRDYVVPSDDDAYAGAWGVDVEVGAFRAEGVHLQAGVVRGDNWKVLDGADEPVTFLSAQGILSYYRPLRGGGPFVAVEPLARVGWGEADTDVEGDGALLVTPGLMLYLGGRNKLGANLDVYSPPDGDAEWSLKVQSFLHF